MREPDQSKDISAAQAAQPSSAPAAKRNWFARHWFISLLALLIGSCAFFTRDRTVSWEEEVPLNTGETIWVKRYVTYKLQGAGGNPMDIGYSPDWTEEIAFEWKGKKYRYVGDADIMLIAISPLTKQPVLVAGAGMKGWDYKNRYRCTIPFYVQFIPSADGRKWTWPPAIEPWLFNMPYNLMYHRAEMNRVMKRYTAKDRAEADSVTRKQSPSLAQINPNAKSNSCIKWIKQLLFCKFRFSNC